MPNVKSFLHKNEVEKVYYSFRVAGTLLLIVVPTINTCNILTTFILVLHVSVKSLE